jgi:aspartate kinase
VSQPGSLVVSDADAPERRSGTIVGVAGKRDFTVIRLEKMLMNAEVGFIERVTRVFSHYGVSIECIPGGLDSICVTVASSAVKKHLDAILLDLEEECRPDVLKVIPELALVCTVGNAMDHAKGVAAKLFRAVSDAGVNVSTIVQCASEKSIIIGVENADCEKAIAAIYRAFA